jgi:hypothetical protein
MKIKSYSVFFIAVFFLFIVQTKNYPIGTLAKINYGFFPLIICILLLILSIISFFIEND